MSPSKRLKPVQRITESREHKAAQALGDSRRRAQHNEARLEELKTYHREYLARFRQSSATGISSAQLQEYRAFLGKLEMAIKEQEKIVQAGQRECSSRREVWQQKHIKTQVLGKLMDRFEDAGRRDQDSREQRELDDRNQRTDGDGAAE